MVVIIIGIQIIGYAVAVGIIVGRVAVLGIVVGQSNIFVNGVNTIAVVIYIVIIGLTVGVGVLGIVGCMISVRVGIFHGCGHMVIVIVIVQEIGRSVAIPIQNRVV